MIIPLRLGLGVWSWLRSPDDWLIPWVPDLASKTARDCWSEAKNHGFLESFPSVSSGVSGVMGDKWSSPAFCGLVVSICLYTNGFWFVFPCIPLISSCWPPLSLAPPGWLTSGASEWCRKVSRGGGEDLGRGRAVAWKWQKPQDFRKLVGMKWGLWFQWKSCFCHGNHGISGTKHFDSQPKPQIPNEFRPCLAVGRRSARSTWRQRSCDATSAAHSAWCSAAQPGAMQRAATVGRWTQGTVGFSSG